MISLWLWPTLFSAAALGFYDVTKKHAVKENSVMPVLFFATCAGTLFLLAASMVTGRLTGLLDCPAKTFGLIWLKSMLVSGSWICVYYAMRELPISLASPIRSTSPLWTAAGGILLYREIPTLMQGAGMLIILIGYGLFSSLGKKEGFSWKNRGMLLMIFGTILGAGSALYDKFLLNTCAIDRMLLQFWFSVDLVAVLGVSWALRRFFGQHHPFQWRWSVPLTGILLIVADFAYFFALSQADAPISLISLVRRCSCAVSFFVGVWIFHDVRIREKALALLLLLAGVILLALGR